MAKKPVSSAVTKKPAAAVPAAKAAPAKVAPVSTPVRNTAVPKAASRPAARKEVTYNDIAKRAYEIYCSGTGGSEADNWYRAERELRGL